MFVQKTLFLSLLAVCSSFSGVISAAPFTVSTSGTFSTAATATALVTPGADWNFRFNLDSQPVASNTRIGSFDVAFSDFSYIVNSSTVAAAPSSIRFSDTAGLGLFTLYFGPESGVQDNGNYTPEFAFYGPQLYSGTVDNPTVLTGSFPVSESLFADGANYDDQFAPGTSVLVRAGSTSAVPEPSTMGFLSLALALFTALRVRRIRRVS